MSLLSKATITKTDSPQYATMKAELEKALGTQRVMFDYNELSELINSMGVGDITDFEFKPTSLPALRNKMTERGLDHGVDYTAAMTQVTLEDAVEASEGVEAKPAVTTDHVIITRLTSKVAKIITQAPRGRKPSGPAAAAGATTDGAQNAAQAAPAAPPIEGASTAAAPAKPAAAAPAKAKGK